MGYDFGMLYGDMIWGFGDKEEASAPARPAPPKAKRVTGLQKRFAELTGPGFSIGKLFGGGKKDAEGEAFVIKTVQMILEEAVAHEASDIHMEPQTDVLRVRFRVDGLLEEVLEIPKELNLRIISRIRVMCGLNPEQSASVSKPEDGRMTLQLSGREIDIRLATFPTIHGDKAVLRLMDLGIRVPDLGHLGLESGKLRAVRGLIERPQGMVAVTGPAGSGKSTTLYAILQTLNNDWRNIVTLEDPVELRLRGVSQSAVQPKMGFAFSDGLRAVLRQDPNVIMVGEVRDRETVEIAMTASLTGHLLFTSLHTNSAVGAVVRLLDMGMEPYLVASSLTAVLAQRLARRVCPSCKAPYSAGPEVRKQFEELAARARMRLPEGCLDGLVMGKGCEECRGTGYRGRVLVLELLPMSRTLRGLVLQKASVGELQKVAESEGMETLLADGLRKVLAGRTTLVEVLRVVSV